MQENATLIESLLERATEYAKTSIEVSKLKAIDKSADIISTIIPNAIVFTFIVSFLLFLNLGIAFWLGEVLGKIFYGFLIVASFYSLVAIGIYFFVHKWIKTKIYNFIIRKILK